MQALLLDWNARERIVKFGILQFFSWPERRVALPTVYQRALQRIEIMDRAGYDAVWLTEHHFSDYSVCPSIPVMGAHVAARTTKLRIGAGVTLAAFYHPLRLAEEIALLDILSGGRVNWGAGRGFDAREFRTFGVPMEETQARFREAVDIVLRAWSSERLTYRGRYFSFDDVEVLPKPLQRPHPPMWVAAGSVDAVTWAAAHGYPVLTGPHSTFTEAGEHWEVYRRELARHGHPVGGRELPHARLLAIAATDAEAAAVAREGAKWLLRTYIDAKRFGDVDPVQRYVDSVVVHGTPERVIDQIARLHEEIGLDYLIGAPLSHETFLSFTDRVLPKFL
ncbi:MAG TPA: LLM class flavin-dependent oxidoreductase [Candidatus Binataceae bacterium]|jgi:alkanesulfonate monooxygenase SsuD/methylene tetrahydromethanopterin reductase-like flavin-dependent oxidoreductase (luciferase family)|nr:LLM class flavin-dependent oxidoreductase [Candidatus Binataceae bacterium]